MRRILPLLAPVKLADPPVAGNGRPGMAACPPPGKAPPGNNDKKWRGRAAKRQSPGAPAGNGVAAAARSGGPGRARMENGLNCYRLEITKQKND